MRRTPTLRTMVAGALLLVVAVTTALLVRSSGVHAPPTGPPPGPVPVVPAGALTGDVDGDGTSDVVTLSRDDQLRVRLGSGGTVAHFLQFRPRLEGLAAVGGPGLAVVVSEVEVNGSRALTAWVVHGQAFTSLRTHGRAVLGDESGSSTAWVSGHRLYDGTLDPLQRAAPRVAVVSRRWTLRDGVLTGRAAGIRCWDRVRTTLPRLCAPGQDWTFDVGTRGNLPQLLPTVKPAWADRSRTSFGGGVWKVRNLDRDVDPEAAPYDLTHTQRGVTHTARVPVGWAPALFGSPVRLPDGTRAVLLSQEGGDSDTWRVYVDRGGRVQSLPTRGPVPLGGGFTETGSGQSVLYSWLTPQGRLFTRVGAAHQGRYHVYQWLPSGGRASATPTLVAHDIGIVCIDETLGTYGTCR